MLLTLSTILLRMFLFFYTFAVPMHVVSVTFLLLALINYQLVVNISMQLKY